MNISLVLLLLLTCCHNEPQGANTRVHQDKAGISRQDSTIAGRFPPPEGYTRTPRAAKSFAAWLCARPLKPEGTPVHLYNGEKKGNQTAHAAVIDMEIGQKDLLQCADAAMRLRAEYLYEQQAYGQIHFKLTNGFEMGFQKWAKGYRVQVKGNTTTWVKKVPPSASLASFRAYLDFVFSYAGSLSLSRELPEIPLDSIAPGDIIIKGGSPGHVVMVMDAVQNPTTGHRLLLLAQGYMPAQDVHILVNPKQANRSPWYAIDDPQILYTPEWTFDPVIVRRFLL